MSRMLRRTLAGAIALACGTAGAADLPLWELGAGGTLLRLPHYRGSDQSHTWALPLPYVVYRGRILKADRQGARAVLFESDRIDFDLSLGAAAPTRSEDNRARRGMADLPPSLEFGPNLNIHLAQQGDWKLDLRAPLRAAVTIESQPRAIGWVSTPNLNLDVRDVRGWNVGLQAALVFADRRYHQHFYGVSAAQALPDRPAYEARGGGSGAQFTLATSRRFDRTWVAAFMRYDTLNGARIEDSPLVRQRNNLSVGIAVSYVFATSSRSVDSQP